MQRGCGRNGQVFFPGSNFKAATGRLEAAFDAKVSPSSPDKEGVTGSGQLTLVVNAGAIRLERAAIHTEHSELTAAGPVTRDGSAALDVAFRSEDMSEVWRAVEAFGVISDEVKEQYEIGLSGSGEFKGRLDGTFSEPKVTGHLSLAGIQLHSEEAGAFEGDILIAFAGKHRECFAGALRRVARRLYDQCSNQNKG